MFYLGFIYLIVLAVLLSLMFSYGFRMRGPWGSFWSFFAIIFLAVWAADIWITPFGPYWYNINWFPPLVVGVLFAVLLAAATPSSRSKRKSGSTHPPSTEFESNAIATTLGVFFWLLLTLFILAIIIGLFSY